MTLETSFVAYLLLHRLAIIAVGLITILLGHSLFSKALTPEQDSKLEGSDVHFTTASFRLTLRNAAPGSCFALFGVGLIVWSIIASPPQLSMEQLVAQRNCNPGADPALQRLTMRGQPTDPPEKVVATSLTELISRGREIERGRGIEIAGQHYEAALNTLSYPLNQLAWHRLQRGELFDALRMAELAVQLQPRRPAYLDTLARILMRSGDKEGAIQIMERAAALDEAYADDLDRIKGETE